MTTHYIWSTVPNGTTGGTEVPYTTLNTPPAKVAGDLWLFPIGGPANAFTNANPGVQTYCFDIRDSGVSTGAFDPVTGRRVISPLRPDVMRALNIFPDDTLIAKYYAIVDGGVDIKAPSVPAASYGASRGVNTGGSGGGVLSGLCIQNCWQSGIEITSNAGVAVVDGCIVRKIGVNGTGSVFGGNSIRSTATERFIVQNTFADDESEDCLWAGVNTNGFVVRNSWFRKLAVPASLPSANHTDNIQGGVSSLNILLDRCYLQTFLPESLATDGLARIGSCMVNSGTGLVIIDSIFESNCSSVNTQSANVTLLNNEFHFFVNPATVAKDGFMETQITLGAGGGHRVSRNYIFQGPGLQSGTNGFVFAVLSGQLGNSTVDNNTFVGNGRTLKNGVLFNFGTGAGALVVVNNHFIDFDRAICGTAPGTENYNGFTNVTLRVTTSQTGGTEAALGAQSKNIPEAAFDRNAANAPVYGGALMGAGQHIAYRRDRNGRQFYNPPSIGRLEIPRAAA